MRKDYPFRYLTLMWLLTLSACGPHLAITVGENLSPPPPNFRELIAVRLGSEIDEAIAPTSAEVSAPFVGTSKLGAASLVCVRVPKMNSAGSSMKVMAVKFRTNEIVDVDLAFGPGTCVNALYEPFPELQQYYKGPMPKKPNITRGGEYKY